MNDGESPGPVRALEDALAAWDEQLAGLEKQAGATLRAARKLRKAAHEGMVAGFPAAVSELQKTAAALHAALAAPRDAKWQPNRPGEGPLVPLADIYDLLTLMPAAAADYPLEEFLLDLLRLDRQPDARSGRGHRFELGGSTGTKGAKRLSAYDETGAQHDYYAIRFISE